MVSMACGIAFAVFYRRHLARPRSSIPCARLSQSFHWQYPPLSVFRYRELPVPPMAHPPASAVRRTVCLNGHFEWPRPSSLCGRLGLSSPSTAHPPVSAVRRTVYLRGHLEWPGPSLPRGRPGLSSPPMVHPPVSAVRRTVCLRGHFEFPRPLLSCGRLSYPFHLQATRPYLPPEGLVRAGLKWVIFLFLFAPWPV